MPSMRGQPEIQHDEIRPPRAGKRQGVVPLLCGRTRVAGMLQIVARNVGDSPLVIHDQDCLQTIPPSCAAFPHSPNAAAMSLPSPSSPGERKEEEEEEQRSEPEPPASASHMDKDTDTGLCRPALEGQRWLRHGHAGVVHEESGGDSDERRHREEPPTGTTRDITHTASMRGLMLDCEWNMNGQPPIPSIPGR